MGTMNDSMAHPGEGLASLELPGWKTASSWTSALLLALLFLVSGLWKVVDPLGWSQRISQLNVPQSLSLAGALAFGIAETMGAVLIIVPRFRRWGAILVGVLLLAFMAYFALNYNMLRGAECSCFPWVKRVVGPEFFMGDGLMLLLAVCAGVWSKPSGSLRSAMVIAGVVTVFAFVSYGVEATRQTGTRSPDTVTVNGQPYAVGHGKVLFFFFNPLCTHCFDSAKRMSSFQWGDTRVVGVPVEQMLYAPAFMNETGLKAPITSDVEVLKKTFSYTAYPFAVAVENGREKTALTKFENDEPRATLKQLGFIR
jgi:uncharacterized membrane protein YphA (DoxX/SURF4 family)